MKRSIQLCHCSVPATGPGDNQFDNKNKQVAFGSGHGRPGLGLWVGVLASDLSENPTSTFKEQVGLLTPQVEVLASP